VSSVLAHEELPPEDLPPEEPLPEEPLPEEPLPEELLPEEPLPEELLPEEPLPEALLPEEPLPEALAPEASQLEFRLYQENCFPGFQLSHLHYYRRCDRPFAVLILSRDGDQRSAGNRGMIRSGTFYRQYR